MLHNPPIDIPFVDLTTGMVTRPWQEWLIINKRDKANRVEGGTEDNLAVIDADGHPKDSLTTLPDGEFVGTTDPQELENKTFAELVGTKILASDGAGGLSEIDLDDWITGIAGRILVGVTDPNDGTVTLTVPLKADFGITSDANGLSLKQQTNVADAVAVSAVTLTAGTDQVNITTCNTTLATLVTEINAIKDVVNAILALLLASEAMEGP